MLFPLEKRTLIRGFQDHLNDDLKGATDYEAPIGTKIYSPFYGRIYHFQEDKGGKWIGIEREDGAKFEFAHLSAYKMPEGSFCKPNDLIALSGNSGTVTTGPHVHHQIIKDGERIDPELFYTPKNIPVIAVNGTIPLLKEFQDELLNYSAGMFTISWDIIEHPLHVGQGMLTQTEAYEIAKQLYNDKYKPYRYLFMCYQGNPLSAFLASYFNPAQNNCITTAPLPTDGRSLVFEFSHLLQMFYNENRGTLPPIQIVDSNFPTDALIISKYRSVLPYTDILLKP